jgi:hypothetical protein
MEQDFDWVQMSASGCNDHYEFVLGAEAKAKSVTNNLPIIIRIRLSNQFLRVMIYTHFHQKIKKSGCNEDYHFFNRKPSPTKAPMIIKKTINQIKQLLKSVFGTLGLKSPVGMYFSVIIKSGSSLGLEQFN